MSASYHHINQHHYAMNNNAAKQVANAPLNPLAACDASGMSGYSGMTHNERGLRAASHVSMEHTAQAHEYNPTCPCPDCQDVLTNFTQYHILDAFTGEHLRFEAAIQAAYGFVPAKGTPYNYVARSVCVGRDEHTGEDMVEQQFEYANAYFFHSHIYEMNPVPADVKERSHMRFYENNNNNNNNNASSAPMVPAPRRHHQNNHHHQQAPVVTAAPAANNTNNTNSLARAFATHQNVYYHKGASNNNSNTNVRRNYNNNNYYAAPQQQQQQQQNPFYYTRSDVDQAAQSVAYSGVATLGY